MIISIHQPAYLPWLGYFDKINNSDLFVFLDTVQFQKNSFQNRNMILSSKGPIWLTVPIKNEEDKIIKNIKIFNNNKWKKKHIDTIKFNYSKSLNFEKIYEELLFFYNKDWYYLNELCFEMLKYFCKKLNINTKIIRLSEVEHVDGHKGDLILNICKKYKAKKYFSGINGINYLNTKDFKKNNIQVIFQNFDHPTYKQINNDQFTKNLSIVDYLMNTKMEIFYK